MSKEQKNALAYAMLLFLAWWFRDRETVTATINTNPDWPEYYT
jgi:lipopolysaccharide export system protein LptC